MAGIALIIIKIRNNFQQCFLIYFSHLIFPNGFWRGGDCYAFWGMWWCLVLCLIWFWLGLFFSFTQSPGNYYFFVEDILICMLQTHKLTSLYLTSEDQHWMYVSCELNLKMTSSHMKQQKSLWNGCPGLYMPPDVCRYAEPWKPRFLDHFIFI